MSEKNYIKTSNNPRLGLKYITGFVALLTPLAYLVGDSYHQGYFSGYDSDSTILGPSIVDT